MKIKDIRNLIFDLDGTLVDSSAGVIGATNYALRSIGESARKPDEIIRFIGYPLKEMFEAFSRGSYDDFWKYFQEKAVELMAASTVPIGNADNVIRRLHARGYKIGIGTTKLSIHTNSILDKFNWTDLISAIIGADDVETVKPDPEAFIKVMKLMHADASDSIVIGDTINDVFAARAASMPVIAVRSIFGRDGDLERSEPDLLIDNLDALLDIFERPA